MPNLDSAAKAAVASSSFAAAWFIFLDIDGDPLRVTTFGADVTFSSTGDPDLDGHTFAAFGGPLIDVGDASESDNGSEPLLITLSGIVSVDTTLVNDIGDKRKWQGRLARTWFQLYDETGISTQGAIVAHKTGYMSSVPWHVKPDQQVIQLSVENYLAFFSQASNRSYLNQKDYDSSDNSAGATITAANGLRRGGSGAVSGGGVSGGGGGGGFDGGGSRFQLDEPFR